MNQQAVISTSAVIEEILFHFSIDFAIADLFHGVVP